MVLVKNYPFFHLFIFGNIHYQNVFYDSLEKKVPFQAIKTRSSKHRKIEIFPKGLVHNHGLTPLEKSQFL